MSSNSLFDSKNGFIPNHFGSKSGLLKLVYFQSLNLLGLYRKANKIPSRINRVVFVCKGNICRSAVAEWEFKRISSVECCSVGLDTTSGNSANDKISQIAANNQLDLSLHKTTNISDFNPMPGDMYVCMEPKHAVAIKNKIPSAEHVVLMGMFANRATPYIHDPYSCNIEFSNKCVGLILEAVKNLSTRLGREDKK